MAEFMEEHHDGQDEQERDYIADEPMAQRIETMKKNFGHPIPLNQGQGPSIYRLRCL
jgi:hypothetical protein